MEKIVVNAVKKNGKASNPYRDTPPPCEKMQGSRQNPKQTWLFKKENDDRQSCNLRGVTACPARPLKNIRHIVYVGLRDRRMTGVFMPARWSRFIGMLLPGNMP